LSPARAGTEAISAEVNPKYPQPPQFYPHTENAVGTESTDLGKFTSLPGLPPPGRGIAWLANSFWGRLFAVVMEIGITIAPYMGDATIGGDMLKVAERRPKNVRRKIR
jgi:hypothetical protein